MNNSALHVTGVLLLKDGRFFEILEGPEEWVHALHHRIAQDPRHNSLSEISETTIEHRDFSYWPMAFQNLDDTTAPYLRKFSNVLGTSFDPEAFMADSHRSTRAERLMGLFRSEAAARGARH